MILTVTLNAAIDKRYVVDGFKQGEVNRIKECMYTPGGKGLNVSKPAAIDSGSYRALIPEICVLNTVGCGDSMIAGFAIGLSQGLSMEEILRKASAISAAAVLREETGFFKLEDMEGLLQKIEIIRLEV